MGLAKELWQDFNRWSDKTFLRRGRGLKRRSRPMLPPPVQQERSAEVEQPVSPTNLQSVSWEIDNKINKRGEVMAKKAKQGKMVQFTTAEGKVVKFRTGKPEPEPGPEREPVTAEQLATAPEAAPARPEPKLAESSPAPTPAPRQFTRLPEPPRLSRKPMRLTPKRPRLS